MSEGTILEVSNRTLEALEWHKVEDALAERCETPQGQELAKARNFSADAAEIRRRLSLVNDVAALIERKEFISLSSLEPVDDLLAKVRKGGVLDVGQLRSIASLCEVSGDYAKLYKKLEAEETLPTLQQLIGKLDALSTLAATFRRVLDERGQIRDEASATLFEIRKRKRKLAERIKKRIQEYLTKHELSSLLQDKYYTIREDRYVLPVDSHHRKLIPGVVHGTSKTGQTVYIEPQELVEMNNELKLLEAEEEEEIRRILREVSAQIAAFADELEQNAKVLAQLDFSAGCARLASDIDAHAPKIVENSEKECGFRYIDARHPLLVLRGVSVVPNEIRLGRGEFSTLVISGPNTGGKTVSLKTAGLLTLMVQAGLPIPAYADSELVPYRKIMCEIGDEQSLEEDLSTFSANIKSLNEMLASAQKGVLLLLDEIIVGTEPLQGASLAVAFLEGFTKRGAHVVVTTHYEQVKLFAQKTSGFMNAAVGIDPDTGKPNYVLTIGVPGTSSALRIAAELGVPDEILRRAEELAGQGSGGVEEAIVALNQQSARLRKLEEEIKAKLANLERKEIKLSERLEKVQSEREELARLRNEAKRKAYLEAIDEVKGIIRKLRRAETTAAEAKQALEEIKQKEKAIPRPKTKLKTHRPPWSDAVKAKYVYPGLEVWVEGYGRTGVVLERPDRNGDVLVEIGTIKSRVSLSELYVSRSSLDGNTQQTKRSISSQAKVVRQPDSNNPLVLDLRGMRVDEAIPELERFLDRAFTNGLSEVEVIHGHGTGALKRAVREYLLNSPYVADYRSGDAERGGDGITIVKLK